VSKWEERSDEATSPLRSEQRFACSKETRVSCHWPMRLTLPMLLLLLVSPNAWAQAEPSGALDFAPLYGRSHSDRDLLGLSARAMAVDRVPDTVVGRFGELHAAVGLDLDGSIFAYAVDFKLGVGVATDYFVLFAASGILFNAYQAIDDAGEADSVEPAVGHPLTLGLWLTPIDGLYSYILFEPAWYWWVDERQVDDFVPFGFGEECSMRVGIGFEVSELPFRLDYTYHQVEPTSWHLLSFGIGVKPPEGKPEPIRPGG